MLLSISEKRFSHFYNEKVLTFRTFSDIIIKQSEGNHGRKCRNGGIGRRPGLKIPWDFFSYRFDPGFRHHHIAEWSSLAARRAHNPKVMRFKSHLRNQKNSGYPFGCPEFFPFDCRVAVQTSRPSFTERERKGNALVPSGSIPPIRWRNTA